MTRIVSKRAGQPLLAIAAVLIVWVGVRSVLWESPFPAIADFLEDTPLFAQADTEPTVPALPAAAATYPPLQAATAATMRSASFAAAHSMPIAMPAPIGKLYYAEERAGAVSAIHQRLWMAAMAQAASSAWEPSQGSTLLLQPGTGDAASPMPRSRPASRWSFDSWLFLRQNNGADKSAGPLPATYGASQAGAVIRYRLSRSSDNKPAAYLRATKALAGPSQAEISAGLSARPAAKLPLAAMIEARLSRNGSQTRIRPAALVVSEIPATSLPLKFRGQTYLQAGYVGGEFATAFADGQVKLDRKLAQFDLGSLHAGAGAWGGIQKGAERIDVGPSASLDMKIGEAPVRIAMDYRHRVAGDAVPQSGIALTVSTGF